MYAPFVVHAITDSRLLDVMSCACMIAFDTFNSNMPVVHVNLYSCRRSLISAEWPEYFIRGPIILLFLLYYRLSQLW